MSSDVKFDEIAAGGKVRVSSGDMSITGSPGGGNLIVVDGKEIRVPGGIKNLSIHDGKVFIDGKEFTEEEGTEWKSLPEITIIVQGDVHGDVEGHHDIQIGGDVGGGVKTLGRVTCGAVNDDVKSQGNVVVRGDVGGNVKTQGKVEVHGDVLGTIHTMGKVVYGGEKVISKAR